MIYRPDAGDFERGSGGSGLREDAPGSGDEEEGFLHGGSIDLQNREYRSSRKFADVCFYFRASKCTSTSVFTLIGWPPFTVGL